MNLNLFIARKIGGNGNIACFSVAISILVVFLAIAISEGFKKEIGDRAVGFSGEILFTAPAQDITNDLYPINKNLSYLPELSMVSGLETISPVAYKPGMLKTDENAQGVLCKGVDSLYSLDFFARQLVEGRLPDFSTKRISNEILISKRLADMMSYAVGDDLVAYFIDDAVRVRKFKITGFYSIQLEDIDKTLTLVDIRHVQRLNGWNSNEVSGFELRLSKGADRDEVLSATGIIAMNAISDDDSALIVKDVGDVYPHLFDWLDLIDLNVLIMLVLMIVVAGFNMISGLLILLFKKVSMIGLLKALGMKDRDIAAVFISRGGIIVLKGMAIGNIIAVILCFLQWQFRIISLDPANYFVQYIPIHISLGMVLLLNLVSLLIMLLIMIIPSFFIAKFSPSKALKIN